MANITNDSPVTPASPSSKKQSMRELSLWSFLRAVLSQGGDIWLDHQSKSYEEFSARLDAAARERADELEAALSAKHLSDETFGSVPSRVFDLTCELRRYFDSGTLDTASDLYLLLCEIEAMRVEIGKCQSSEKAKYEPVCRHGRTEGEGCTECSAQNGDG